MPVHELCVMSSNESLETLKHCRSTRDEFITLSYDTPNSINSSTNTNKSIISIEYINLGNYFRYLFYLQT